MILTGTLLKKPTVRTFFVFAVIYVLLSCHSASAQNPLMVGDITTTLVYPGNDDPVVTSNGILYFATYVYPVYSLWRSDGTDAGTFVVRNNSYPISFYGSNGTTFNGLFFFAMDDGEHGYEIWKSNGTVAGTTLLKDIINGNSGLFSAKFMAAGNTLYLNVEISNNHWQLWKTDGTETGTVLVKDNIYVELSIALNGKLIFSSDKTGTGQELWVTDGTPAGTKLVKDINPGTASSSPAGLVVMNNLAWFFAYQPSTGNDLWKTDGTETGTLLVKDFDPLSQSNNVASKLKAVNNKLFMSVTTTANGSELWVSDGSTVGTQILEINAAGGSAGPDNFAELDSKLFFSANDGGHGNELWSSDGTVAGTQLVKDINPAFANADPGYSSNFNVKGIFSVNGQLYFRANDGVHGAEPWHSDGTAAGTGLLYDLAGGTAGSEPGNFTAAGSKTIFLNYLNSSQQDLWTTDGTTAGTLSISAAVSGTGDDIHFPVALNNKVFFSTDYQMWFTDGTVSGTQPLNLGSTGTSSSYLHDMVKRTDHEYLFAADDDVHGDELWRTDGTPSGTHLVKDIFPGNNGSEISAAKATIGGKIFFRATSGSSQTGLWISDGTAAGTKKLSDCDPVLSDVNNWYQLTYVELNNVLYFVAGNPTYEQELWRSDGTVTGTYQVSFISTGNAEVKDLALSNGIIYFHARDQLYGREVFRSDGTTAGTMVVKDINPVADASPEYLTVYNGKVYFRAYDGSDAKLWVTDGTAAGTKMVKNVGGPKGPSYLTVSGNYLYFSATSPATGDGIWKSDGTAAGTNLLKDVDPDDKTAFIASLTNVNGTLFFTANQGAFAGLWKSDGTDTGTVKITEFKSATLSQLNRVNNDLYFVNEDMNDSKQLWRSDGTACRTQELDFVPVYSDQTNILLVDGSTLFLGLLTPEFGNELWKYETFPISPVETCNGFDDDCNGMVDDDPVAIVDPSGNITACKGIPITLTTESANNLSYQWLKNGNAIAGATAPVYTTLQAGNFSVTVNSFPGCNAVSALTTINRINNPAATITPLGILDICLSGSVDLQANNGVGYTYQWSKNNQPIVNATNQTYHATSTGNYKVLVTNASSCNKLSSKTTVTNTCKESTMDDDSNASLDIYPNPFSNAATIRFQVYQSTDVSIVLTDVSGGIVKIIFNGSLSEGLHQFNFERQGLLPGIYFLCMTSTEEILTRKVIIE